MDQSQNSCIKAHTRVASVFCGLLLAMMLLQHPTCHAQDVAVDLLVPNNVLITLGDTIDLLGTTAQPEQCVQAVGEPKFGGADVRFRKLRVTNTSEIEQSLSWSVSAKGAYGAYSGSASYSFQSEATFERNSILVVYSYIKQFAIESRTYQLLPSLAQGVACRGSACNSADRKAVLDDLFRRCGTHVVTSERRGAVVAGLFKAINVKRADWQKINASATGEVGDASIAGGELNFSFNSFLSHFQKDGRLQIRAQIIGMSEAGAPESLEQDLFGAKNESQVNALLAKAAAAIDKANAKVIEVQVTPLSHLVGSVQPYLRESAYAPSHRLKLFRDQETLWMNEAALARLNAIVSSRGAPPFSYLDANELAQYGAERDDAAARLRADRAILDRCSRDWTSDCAPPLEPLEVVWPTAPVPEVPKPTEVQIKPDKLGAIVTARFHVAGELDPSSFRIFWGKAPKNVLCPPVKVAVAQQSAGSSTYEVRTAARTKRINNLKAGPVKGPKFSFRDDHGQAYVLDSADNSISRVRTSIKCPTNVVVQVDDAD